MMRKPYQFAGRTAILRMLLLVLASAVPAASVVHAQALPAAEASPISTGFALPTVLGTLQYAVTASESLEWGFYGGGSTSSTNISGDLAYLSPSRQYPFSLVLTGGHSFGEHGQPGYSFVGLSFSQVANMGRWNIVLSDSLNYLPGTPAAGLAGIPGVGDLNVNPVQISGDAGQGVLTNYSDRVSNTAAVSVSRQLTGKTSVSASGAYSISRFIDGTTGSATQSGAGLDSNGASGQASISHQIDARSSFGGSYSYSKSTFPGNNFGTSNYGFVSQTASGQYSYRFNRRLSVNVAAGPQWTTISGVANSKSTSLFADAGATYAGRTVTTGLTFVRSTNNGFGTTAGALSDSVVFTANRTFDVVWNVSGTASYTRSSSLPAPTLPTFSTQTYVEAVQVSRAIVRNLSGFASYTFEDQSSAGTAGIDVFSGRSQVLGFGITYSPGSIHLGRP
jgi:hypothetical protein